MIGGVDEGGLCGGTSGKKKKVGNHCSRLLCSAQNVLTRDQDHLNIELWRTGCQEVSKGLFKKYFILYPHLLLPGSTTFHALNSIKLGY